MSGFDFGALRDPDAPQPGPDQREGVEMRARELMTRARRWRMLASCLAFVAVAAAVVGVVATRETSPELSVTNQGTTTIAPTSSTSTSTTHLGVVAPSTTTTTPVVAPPNAVSASFVSTDHGWLVESNGDVVTTTDGGATWRAEGSLGRPVTNLKLRFADANRGFAVPTGLADQATTLVTDDGGSTWKPLELPFAGRIYDLAISRGTIYAVAFDNANFRMWSSPADNMTWTRDPITIPVGAGPVPVVQLVFWQGAGWLIEVDRTVGAGARLDKHGRWLAWTPPCSAVNGPAFLAAWSTTDLIASCDEGVWGSPPAPAKAVYTSHDGGITFQRYSAPAYGAVAAADPNYAVLVTGDTIRRSVDGGRTWTEVLAGAAKDARAPLDLGFTSNTQGFVILANNQMLMTHDAGATWSAVTKS